MSIYGLGAMYGSTEDMSGEFVQRGIACVGWLEEDSAACREMMRSLTVGDIVFIKSYTPTGGLYLRTVGLVTDNRHRDMYRDDGSHIGYGVGVRWVWSTDRSTSIHLGKQEDRLDYMRRGTLYPEHNIEVQAVVIHLLLGGKMDDVNKIRADTRLIEQTRVTEARAADTAASKAAIAAATAGTVAGD